MKVCTKCGVEKPFSEFHKGKKRTGVRPSRGGGGVTAICKVCKAEHRRPGLAAERAYKQSLAESGFKKCGSCEVVKPLSDFHKRVASPDGLAYKCAACIISTCSEWRNKNPGAFARWYAENRQERAEYWRQWYEANKGQRSQTYATWAKENKHIVNALVAKRTAAKFNATPSWANFQAMREFFAEAARLTLETGIRHEVDHIYPLQGKLVCGLHCEANLQILTKVENIRKSNRMPEIDHESKRHYSANARHGPGNSGLCGQGVGADFSKVR